MNQGEHLHKVTKGSTLVTRTIFSSLCLVADVPLWGLEEVGAQLMFEWRARGRKKRDSHREK